MLKYSDYQDCMELFGFEKQDTNLYKSGDISCSYRGNNLIIKHNTTVYATTDFGRAILFIEAAMQVTTETLPIMAAINTKNLAQNLVRVRSSNVWAVGFNVKNKGDKVGDLVIQFKNKNGGGGDVYIYFDVPLTVYRRMMSTTSFGHFVWEYIRNSFNYSKLTGNKRGVLPNAINN